MQPASETQKLQEVKMATMEELKQQVTQHGTTEIQDKETWVSAPSPYRDLAIQLRNRTMAPEEVVERYMKDVTVIREEIQQVRRIQVEIEAKKFPSSTIPQKSQASPPATSNSPTMPKKEPENEMESLRKSMGRVKVTSGNCKMDATQPPVHGEKLSTPQPSGKINITPHKREKRLTFSSHPPFDFVRALEKHTGCEITVQFGGYFTGGILYDVVIKGDSKKLVDNTAIVLWTDEMYYHLFGGGEQISSGTPFLAPHNTEIADSKPLASETRTAQSEPKALTKPSPRTNVSEATLKPSPDPMNGDGNTTKLVKNEDTVPQDYHTVIQGSDEWIVLETDDNVDKPTNEEYVFDCCYSDELPPQPKSDKFVQTYKPNPWVSDQDEWVLDQEERITRLASDLAASREQNKIMIKMLVGAREEIKFLQQKNENNAEHGSEESGDIPMDHWSKKRKHDRSQSRAITGYHHSESLQLDGSTKKTRRDINDYKIGSRIRRECDDGNIYTARVITEPQCVWDAEKNKMVLSRLVKYNADSDYEWADEDQLNEWVCDSDDNVDDDEEN